MACQTYQPTEYYDLKVLKRQNLPLDRIVDFVTKKNDQRLRRYKSSWNPLLGFQSVTSELVIDFKDEAIAHVKHIQNNRDEYGFLYNVIDDKDPMSPTLYIKYKDFALVENGTVIPKIQQLAAHFYPRDTDYYDATCLYLLIFYTLLVNRHANWLTIDYITHCNLNHQYAAYITWSK